MIDCCIFDLDGTLINSLDDLADSCNCALSDMGFPVHAPEQYRQFVGDGIFTLMDRILPPDQRNRDKAEALKGLFDAYYQERYLDKTAPYPGIPELIRLLWEKGVKMAVVSNKPDAFVQKIVGALFSAPSFDLVLGQSAVIPKKPDPTGVCRVLDQLGVEKKRCLYIGDSNVDVLTAKNAQIRCVGAAWGFRGEKELREAGAYNIIQNPMDLVDLLDA